ncbi:MAG: hypothetical protein Hyperionvirus43_1, partial [Hyperionvirus sp.]
KYLQQSNLNSVRHKSSVYWLFDLSSDKVMMNTYEQFAKLNNQEQTKYIISKLYDDILYEAYYEIITKLNSFKELPLYLAYRIIGEVERRAIGIPRNSDLYNKLEEKIFYEKYERVEPRYDENEDQFFGLSGNVIKLERVPDKQPPPIQTVRIDIAQITQKERNIEYEEVLGLCQHNITWEYITTLRKRDPNRYGDLLFAFIEQYVVENNEKEFICRSCGFQLNIKRYITDGVFDDDTERFITFSTPMEVMLEDIPEYEKYTAAIRNIDKLIEKIASIANIPYFLGTSPNIKWRRKAVVKDTIDIIMMHNNIMKKNFKERNLAATKLYGISRELSNLFVFDLDNNIFVYTSKEKDYFKNIKHNNVIAYIIILMVLEINNSHVTFMSGDKKGLCNFSVFEKVNNLLFEGLKFRKNKAGDLTEIKKYRIFAYILYIISCMSTKYNIWHYEYTEEPKSGKQAKQLAATKLLNAPVVGKVKKKTFDPKIQKIIIHTVVDVLNSILEVSGQKDVHRLYEIIATKFYRKIRDTFANQTLINMFKSEDKSSMSLERKDFIFTKPQNIILSGKYVVPPYDEPYYAKCKAARYYVRARVEMFIHYFHINNITNCPTGQFHNWVLSPKTKKFVCSRCGTSIDVEYDEKLSKEIRRVFKYVALQDLGMKYCHDGTLHNYIYSDEKTCSVCNKCKLAEDYKFSHEELDKLELNVTKYKNQAKIQSEMDFKARVEREVNEQTYETKVIEKLIEHYKRDNTADDSFKFIDQYLNNIQSIIGEQTEISNANILLKDNLYIIDHDHLGYPLEKPIVISDRDNRISYKSNHPFFKTDVIFYTSHKIGKLDVFYDAITHILLGYRESSKDYVLSKKTDKKIKLNYSIANKLKLMGYSSHYINIKEKYEKSEMDIRDMVGEKVVVDKDDLSKEVLTDIVRKRILNLKKVISYFQRAIFRIKNNVSMETKIEKLDVVRNEPKGPGYRDFRQEVVEEIDPLTGLLQQYQKKLLNVKIEDDNKQHKIFKHWKAVVNNLFAESLDDVVINITDTRLLNAEEVSRYDANGNLLLYYIVSEIDKLIHFNTNKVIKTNVIMFMIDFINLAFNIFNTDELYNMYDIKRFMYIVNTHGYLYDIEQKGHGLEDTQGIYQEYKDPDEVESEEHIEALEEAEEEAQALDVDMSYDSLLDYEVQLDDWEPQFYRVIEG